jgi:hypothetical protein
MGSGYYSFERNAKRSKGTAGIVTLYQGFAGEDAGEGVPGVLSLIFDILLKGKGGEE